MDKVNFGSFMSISTWQIEFEHVATLQKSLITRIDQFWLVAEPLWSQLTPLPRKKRKKKKTWVCWRKPPLKLAVKCHWEWVVWVKGSPTQWFRMKGWGLTGIAVVCLILPRAQLFLGGRWFKQHGPNSSTSFISSDITPPSLHSKAQTTYNLWYTNLVCGLVLDCWNLFY